MATCYIISLTLLTWGHIHIELVQPAKILQDTEMPYELKRFSFSLYTYSKEFIMANKVLKSVQNSALKQYTTQGSTS